MIKITAKQEIIYTYLVPVNTVKEGINGVTIDHDTCGLEYPPEIIEWGNPEILKIELTKKKRRIFKVGDRVKLVHSQENEELPSDIKVGTLGWVYGVEFDENEGCDLLDCGWDDGDTWSVYAWEVEHA